LTSINIASKTNDLVQNVSDQFSGGLLAVKEEVSALSKGLAVSQVMRDRLDGVYRLNPDEIDGDRPTRHEVFRGLHKIRQLRVVCRPLTTLYKTQAPRMVSILASLSSALHVEEFLGLLTTSAGEYAVMEDLEAATDVLSVRDALDDDRFASATELNKLRLCYEIVNTVAYLHSLNMVVKVITDSFVFLRFKEDRLWPVFTNLECARSVHVAL